MENINGALVFLFASFFTCSCFLRESVKESSMVSEMRVEAIANIRQSIHFVGNLNSENEVHVEGTGFFINEEGYFATNLHVLLAALEYEQQNPNSKPCVFVLAKYARGSEEVVLSLCGVSDFVVKDDVNDLAVCRILPNPFTDPVLKDVTSCVTLDPVVPEDGEELLVSGFPNQAQIMFSRHAILGSFTSRKHGLTMQAIPVLELDCRSEKGFSGSPVYRPKDSSVIGVVVGGLPSGVASSEGVTDAIPIGKLIDHLEAGGIHWKPAHSKD